MFGSDAARDNWGWLGIDVADTYDPHHDALYYAVSGAGVHAGAFDAEMVAGRTINATATCSNAQVLHYDTAILCTGVQHLGVSVPGPGFDDFTFRFRCRTGAHAGVRDVARLDNDQLIIQLNAADEAEVFDGSQRTFANAGVNDNPDNWLREDGGNWLREDGGLWLLEGGGATPTFPDNAWYDFSLAREGNTLALKIDEVVILRWDNASLNLTTTDWRVGTDNANGCDCTFQDVRFYNKGVIEAERKRRLGYRSWMRRSIIGVGRL